MSFFSPTNFALINYLNKRICILYMKKPVIALALGSGTARGLAHIGVIKVLVQNKIPIDIITGTSMGAVIGSLYANTLDIDKIENIALTTNNTKLIYMLDPSFRVGLIKGKRIERFLKEYLGDASFDTLKLPFVAVATDLCTGNPVYFDSGDLITGIRASLSIPFIFTPVIHDNKVLVDGHLSEPVPVVAAQKKGADIIIAVNLDSFTFDEAIKKPSFTSVASRTAKILLHQLSKSNVEKADVIICPDIGYHRSIDFFHVKEFIKKGEDAAIKALPEIKRVIEAYNKKNIIDNNITNKKTLITK